MKATERVIRAVYSDFEAYVAFMRVGHLLDPPTRLLSPRTLKAFLSGGAGGEPGEVPRLGVD